MAPKIQIVRKIRRERVPVDVQLANLLRDWEGTIKVSYTRGEDIPAFDAVDSALTGGYFKIQSLLKAAGIDDSDEQNPSEMHDSTEDE